MHFLVVEDTVDVAEAIIERLGRGGHACDRAPSLEDAKHFAATSAYDLVILDINLPDGSGLDFLKWLKQAHPRVVLATNADRASLALKLPLTGLESYLDAIVSSEDVGAAKEEQAFWFALQEIEAFDPARTLFIDDNARVLESAREFGIKHLLGIKQPDSQRPEKELQEFIALDRFAHLLPKQLPEQVSATQGVPK